MLLWQSFKIAIEMLMRNKLRSLLTMLGVIIGVMSVTIIVMISGGFQSYLQYEFKKLGADTIIVAFDNFNRARGQTLGGVEGLTVEDMKFLKERVSSIDIISGSFQVPAASAKFEDREQKNPTVFAVDEFFSELNRIDVLEGRHLDVRDITSRANVAVIGNELRDKLFPDKKALGKLIQLPGITLEVVGVLERTDIGPNSTGKMLLIPLSTAQDKWIGGKNLSFLTLRPKSKDQVEKTMNSVWEALMIRSGDKSVYRVDSRESILKVFGAVLGVAGTILAAIAALSLLVGGIGIMNIMLVSVTERTREIGLRKSVGARNGAVLTQFLVEAAMLSMIGGLIGMFVAWSMGQLISLITVARDWPGKGGLSLPFPIAAAIGSALFSAFIGMVFGFYPAFRASRLDPINALRHE